MNFYYLQTDSLDCILTYAYNKPMKKIKYLCIPLILTVFFSGCGQKKQEYIQKTDFKLNTVVQVSIYDKQNEGYLDTCMNLCDRYERIFSRTLPESELYQLNKSKEMEVSDELLELIRLGVDYGERTGGRFDITIAPLSDLWNFSGEEHHVPEAADLAQALAAVDYRNIHMDGNLVTLENGASIDLGALAKGYIADRLKEYLISEGVKSAIINLGGNVLCVGAKPDGEAFQVAIQKPFADRTEAITVAPVTDQSVVTSGIYERGFEEDGVWYHHILDPDTGYPNDTDLSSVTIQSDRSVDGDALSTICMALGSEETQEFLQQYPDIHAWLVTKEGEVLTVNQ